MAEDLILKFGKTFLLEEGTLGFEYNWKNGSLDYPVLTNIYVDLKGSEEAGVQRFNFFADRLIDVANGDSLVFSATGIDCYTTGNDIIFTSTSIQVGTFRHGLGLEANYGGQYIFGQYNRNDQNSIFEIGNGIDSDNRSNLFQLTKDGILSLFGDNNSKIATLSTNEVSFVDYNNENVSQFTCDKITFIKGTASGTIVFTELNGFSLYADTSRIDIDPMVGIVLTDNYSHQYLQVGKQHPEGLNQYCTYIGCNRENKSFYAFGDQDCLFHITNNLYLYPKSYSLTATSTGFISGPQSLTLSSSDGNLKLRSTEIKLTKDSTDTIWGKIYQDSLSRALTISASKIILASGTGENDTIKFNCSKDKIVDQYNNPLFEEEKEVETHSVITPDGTEKLANIYIQERAIGNLKYIEKEPLLLETEVSATDWEKLKKYNATDTSMEHVQIGDYIYAYENGKIYKINPKLLTIEERVNLEQCLKNHFNSDDIGYKLIEIGSSIYMVINDNTGYKIVQLDFDGNILNTTTAHAGYQYNYCCSQDYIIFYRDAKSVSAYLFDKKSKIISQTYTISSYGIRGAYCWYEQNLFYFSQSYSTSSAQREINLAKGLNNQNLVGGDADDYYKDCVDREGLVYQFHIFQSVRYYVNEGDSPLYFTKLTGGTFSEDQRLFASSEAQFSFDSKGRIVISNFPTAKDSPMSVNNVNYLYNADKKYFEPYMQKQHQYALEQKLVPSGTVIVQPLTPVSFTKGTVDNNLIWYDNNGKTQFITYYDSQLCLLHTPYEITHIAIKED